MKLWKELRERRLFQIFISYMAGGWVMISVVDQLVDRGLLPDLLYRVGFTWYLLGLPAVLMIAWNHGEKGKQRAPVSEIALLVLLLVAATGFSSKTVVSYVSAKKLAQSAENPLEMRSIAVRYFTDESKTGGYDYLADGLTEALIAELQQVRGLDVVSKNGTAQFRGDPIPTDSLAAQLQVGTVVEGSIEPEGERLKVNLQIFEGQSGARIQGTSFDAPLTDLATLRETVIKEAARLLRDWIGNEVRIRKAAETTTSNAAWMQLQRAEKLRKDAEARVREGDMRAADALFASADELLVKAERADTKWPDAMVSRAALSYRRARLAQATPELAASYIKETLSHAERALSLDRTNARALELRGTANYYAYLLQLNPEPEAQQELLKGAQQDLESAVQYDPTLASAFATLSHLYYQQNIADAVLAATRAYEQDAYLEAADVVLWRLFNGSLELENFSKARQWCGEGARRFPRDYRFVSCQLRLLVTPGEDADVKAAWQLLARQDSMTPPPRLPFEHARGELTVGGVIARAGLQDSARAVIDRVSRTITPELDRTNELVVTEAYARVLAQQPDRAVDLLTRYTAANPDAFSKTRGEVQWWWRDLQDNPRFRRLVGLK